MKDSEVYLGAAKLIDAGVELYSCLAIDNVVGQYNSVLAENYCTSMGFIGVSDFLDLYGPTGRSFNVNLPAREHRVLLLLLASAIAESEGR